MVRRLRYEKQIKSGMIPDRFKLSPRAAHIPSWSELKESEKVWEARRMEVFAAMIDVIDQNIGRLISDLETRGVLDKTLFLFCADNGGCPFERTRGRNLPRGTQIHTGPTMFGHRLVIPVSTLQTKSTKVGSSL